MVTYSVPLVAGYTYTWSITGGSGSSTTNSIDVTWGAGTDVFQLNDVAGN